MRDLFPGYYRPTDEEFSNLWKEAHFYFDTNVLLNLYRYSFKTSENFIDLLSSDKIKNRIILPHWVAAEYLKNRVSVIIKQKAMYQELKRIIENGIEKVCSSIQNQLRADYIIDQKPIIEKFIKIKEELRNELEDAERTHPNLFENDTICDRITGLFTNRVTLPYSKEKIAEIINDGIRRYKEKIPPGYEDHTKPEQEKFGDLIVWMQIIDDAKERKAPVIFVTDENKQDWWYQVENQTVGPRPELFKEMQERAGVPFYMYKPHSFMLYGQKFLQLHAESAAITEVKHIQQTEEKNSHDFKTRLNQTAGEVLRDPLSVFAEEISVDKVNRLMQELHRDNIEVPSSDIEQGTLKELITSIKSDRLPSYLQQDKMKELITSIKNDRLSSYIRQDKMKELLASMKNDHLSSYIRQDKMKELLASMKNDRLSSYIRQDKMKELLASMMNDRLSSYLQQDKIKETIKASQSDLISNLRQNIHSPEIASEAVKLMREAELYAEREAEALRRVEICAAREAEALRDAELFTEREVAALRDAELFSARETDALRDEDDTEAKVQQESKERAIRNAQACKDARQKSEQEAMTCHIAKEQAEEEAAVCRETKLALELRAASYLD